MESEKLRVVSTVDSTKPRVPIFAARAVDAFLLSRTLSGSFSSAGSIPIRAPLTIDEDDDGSVSDEHNSVTSDASNYSRELDFESVSGDVEDETVLEDVIVGRVRVNELLGEDGSDFSGGSVVYRPLEGDLDEETSVNYSSLEEESENSDDVEGISDSDVSEGDGVSMKAKVIIPRAVLSLDDDEFDEILGSGDEEATLVSVVKDRGDEESEVEVRGLQFREKGVVDEPECSNSIEEEAVRMDCSDKVEDGLISFGSIDDSRLRVPPGGSYDFIVENGGEFIESSMGLGGSFKEPIEKEVVQSSIIKDDDSGSGHEVDALMKLSIVEGVEDSAVEVGEMGMTDKPECSGSASGELGSTEEDMQVNDGLVSLETIEGNSLGVAPVDCNEFLEESEGIAVDEDRRLDESFSQIVEQGVSQESISKENDNRTDYGSSCDADESMSPCEESIGLERRESEDGDTRNMILETKESLENNSLADNEFEKHDSEGETEIGMSYESFQLTPNLDSVTTSNLEVAGGIDAVSGCSSSDQKAAQEAEIEGKRESEDLDRKLSLPDEDTASSLRSSFEMANESVENEQVNKQVKFQSDSESNQISVGIEDSSLLSVKDVESTMPGDSCVIADDILEKETQMARLIHNHTFMELDEYERTDDTREQVSGSTFQDYSEELSSDHSVQLISEKVKERVEKSPLLKEKLQRIIRGIDLCGENSAVTGAVSKLSLSSGEHQTSLGLDYLSDGTKIMLPGQEFPDDLDFSINVLVIGKTGVGKSATVNSIFGEMKSPVGAFGVTTKSANYVVGNVGGILIRILDTPGLMSSATEERFNQEVLMSIKKSMRMFPVDVILYIDRLGENPDIHLLRTITSSLGSSIWQNTIVVLTHAASDVPDSSSSKDFIAQRSSLMHQSIRQAVPELRCVDRSKMPGIVLAENNMSSFCGKTNESTCPDWCLNLLISCCSVKIRSKPDSLQKRNTLVEKSDGSPLRSFTLFCSLWNVLLLGANPGQASSHLHDFEEKKKTHILDSHYDEEHSQEEHLEQETLPTKNQEPENQERRPINKGLEKGTGLSHVRTRRRGKLGFQATKKFGIYLDTSNLHTGFSIGDYRKHKEEEGRILVRMSSSMAVLGLLPMLMSVFTSVYGPKNI
ncbi:hypothetical protein AALP_AA1G328200 [Arabis alpina]|uniref:AIG1-type G domain-containing protein n=1 Tax=Arabis alpina TaxID=50452 RepID=A0A087HS75_ARAAL|nr:hypothetical protein AALP_AA1G328200 [Arabis alpina]